MPAEPAVIKPPRTRWWWGKRIFAAGFVLFLILLVWLAITAPLSKSLQPIAPPEITLLAADGTPIARSGAVVEEPVVVDRLPSHVVQAFLAIEDRRFYSHWGIDPRGLARALWANVSGDSGTQGGSTITQQLAKISFLTPERSLTRKLREMLIAFWLEAWLTKDEILGRYLSNAYFGDNVYGLRAASLHYFDRQPERLKPEQAILLAGLVQAPSRFAPTRNWKGASRRAAMVRTAMVNAGFMTRAEADALPQPRLDVHERPKIANGTYFADWAMPQARALTEMSHARLELTTTLDSRLQRAAERIVARAGLGKAQVALVAMRSNGEVVAMVGGKNHKDSPFNRATQARRQPGSTFKLFVYLAALEAGMEPETLVDDSPITTGTYRPRNAGDRYRGTISLEEAFIHSSNVAAVRLFQQLGSEKVIKQATQLGLKGPFTEGDPSLALGSASASLIELTAAFAGVAGNQWPVVPHAFQREEQGWFEWLVDGPDRYSSRVHEQMQDMLRSAVNRGTGRAASLSVPNFGKTGTSQDNRDALFVGYAGDLVVGVWIGNDDNSPMQGIRGGGLPARIWRQFMGEAVRGAVPPRRVAPAAPPEEIDSDPVIGPLIDSQIDAQVGGANVRVTPDGLTISGDVGGAPVAVTVDGNGAQVERRRPEPPAPPAQ
ncbi:transglycosylase domain-containing protein [Blastomonas aquatica]|uniref:transglycosylase domain-containing protein n=1 Tax=Blastomonas aquatica TaxID=1510276 RepID=UPI003570ADA6